jgi:hypothetical protein
MIKIKVISVQGHKTYNLALGEVKEFISNQERKLGLWLYIDGIHIDIEKMHDEIISSAREIILTKALVGG